MVLQMSPKCAKIRSAQKASAEASSIQASDSCGSITARPSPCKGVKVKNAAISKSGDFRPEKPVCYSKRALLEPVNFGCCTSRDKDNHSVLKLGKEDRPISWWKEGTII
jgi:hypothetical protein